MKPFFPLICFCLFNIVSYSQNLQYTTEKLVGTKWSFSFNDDENIKDYYKFMPDNKYIFFSCETQNKYMGIYFFEKDTLYLVKLGKPHELSYSEGIEHKTLPSMKKCKIKNNSFSFIEKQQIIKEGRWIKSNHVFPEEYLFRKEQ